MESEGDLLKALLADHSIGGGRQVLASSLLLLNPEELKNCRQVSSSSIIQPARFAPSASLVKSISINNCRPTTDQVLSNRHFLGFVLQEMGSGETMAVIE